MKIAKQNEAFYGKAVKAKDILYTAGAVDIPEDSQVRTEVYLVARADLGYVGLDWTCYLP
jgi:hypothetical protein